MFGKKLRIVVAAAFLLQAAWSGSAPLSAQQGTLHNCPQSGKWAISVWEGQNGVVTGQALNTCGDQAVDFAWYLDPNTQAWMGYSAEYPGANDLLTLDNLQGVITHGKVLPPPTPIIPQLGMGRIAFVDLNGEAWIINPDGSGKTFVNKTNDIFGPKAWSPTGDKLALRGDEEDLWEDLLVFDLAGNQLVKINRRVSDMSWSPDGNSVIYGIYVDGIYDLNLKTGKTRQIIETVGFTFDHSPVWSPDGKKIAFVHHEWGSDFYVYIIDFDGKKIPYQGGYRLLVSGQSAHDQSFRFQWTLDSRKLVFASGDIDDSEVGTIYVADVVTGSILKMQPEGFDRKDLRENGYDLSNDGQRIVFTDWSNIYTVNIDGSDMRKIFGGMDAGLFFLGYPRWSPNDSQIAFTNGVLDDEHIYLVNADGTGLKQIQNTDKAVSIAWTRAPR